MLNLSSRKKVIYISYDGVLEPLGRSQVIGYLERIAKNYECFLVSYEKHLDLLNADAFSNTESLLFDRGIIWRPLKYHKRLAILSTFFDLLLGAFTVLKILRKQDIEILHIRGYLPMLIAIPLRRLFSYKIIFDMRGFWPDEKADRAGWSRSGALYKSFKFLEEKFINAADWIVVLTEQSKNIIESTYHNIKNKNISIIRTCVDLDLFNIKKYPPISSSNKEIILASLGSVDTAYDIEPVMRLFKQFLNHEDAKLVFFNKGSHDLILSSAASEDIPLAKIVVRDLKREQIPIELKKIDIGIFFLKSNYSIQASMPTKIGEFLSMGKPIICNNFNKDIEELFRQNQIGLLLDFEQTLNADTVYKIKDLIRDEGVAANCYELCSKYFSLDSGSKEYLMIYSNLIRQ